MKHDFKQGRSTSDNSSASTVVAGDEPEAKELDAAHLQSPIHAGVLLRIESTASESANSDHNRPNQASPSKLDIIEKAESMEVIEMRSDDEGELFKDLEKLFKV